MDAEQYRRRARRYLIRSRQMINPVNRATMIGMAVIWMRLAEWANKPIMCGTKSSLWVTFNQEFNQDMRNEATSPCREAERCRVSIRRLLVNEALQPEHIAVMGEVFEDVLRTLGVVDRTDTLTETVARKVIELARTGDCDADRLRQLTLESFAERNPN